MSVKNRGNRDLRWQLLALYLLFVAPIVAVSFFFYNSTSQR